MGYAGGFYKIEPAQGTRGEEIIATYGAGPFIINHALELGTHALLIVGCRRIATLANNQLGQSGCRIRIFDIKISPGVNR